MQNRILTHVIATDPVTRAGLSAQLRLQPDVRVLDIAGATEESVQTTIIAAESINDDLVQTVRSVVRGGCRGVVLVVSQLDEAGVLVAVEAGASSFVRRQDATSEQLIRAVRSAMTGEGCLPPDMLGRLLSHVAALQRDVLAPRGLTLMSLNTRELDVLRLIADGLDTNEVAKRLSYSERTIKNIIHNITIRLGVRNRTQAVAFALREGLI